MPLTLQLEENGKMVKEALSIVGKSRKRRPYGKITGGECSGFRPLISTCKLAMCYGLPTSLIIPHVTSMDGRNRPERALPVMK